MPTEMVVGRFGRIFGIRGWLRLNSFTVPQENILTMVPWLIRTPSGLQPLFFDEYKIHSGSILVRLRDCDSVAQAKMYVNVDVIVTYAQFPKLPVGEYYWVDLEGLRVINTQGVEFGHIKELMATGSNDVLVVSGLTGTQLIPYLSHTIVDVNLTDKLVTVDWDVE